MHVYIVTGGQIEEEFVLGKLQDNLYDFLIVADKGMNFLHEHEVLPDLLAGDFDSVSEEAYEYFKDKGIEVCKLNPMKDDTDTEFVIREAIRRKAEKITVFGATGGSRADHFLANVQLLGIGLEEQVEIELLDAHNRLRILQGSMTISKEEQYGKFVSLLPIAGDAKGVCLEGFRYPLKDYTMTCFSSLGISNEITEEVARIEVKEGTLLVIESRD